MLMEIAFTLRKNGDYMCSGLGSRSFPMDRQAGWQADENLLGFKSCNTTFNWFFVCLNY